MIFGSTKDGEYKQVKQATSQYIWLDVISPTQEEENALEEFFKIEIPTREEMTEIELSNRLYEEDGILYLTTVVVVDADTESPHTEAVTFIVTPDCIITMRYAEMGAFKQYVNRLPKLKPTVPMQVLSGLIESIINRIADILEKIGSNIDSSSRRVFKDKTSKMRYEDALNEVGSSGDLISKARESLMTFQRALSFISHVASKEEYKTIELMLRDISALSVHADFLSNKAIFLLDATLGMINYEQNNIIKIFTLAALIFLPPTLIAGIYGMNFEVLPELHWRLGYPFALFLMIISAYLPYRLFKKRGWL